MNPGLVLAVSLGIFICIAGTFAQRHMMWPPRPGDETYEGWGWGTKEQEDHTLKCQVLKKKWENCISRNVQKARENKREGKSSEYPPRPGDEGTDEEIGSTPLNRLSDAVKNKIQSHNFYGNEGPPGKRFLARRKLKRSN